MPTDSTLGRAVGREEGLTGGSPAGGAEDGLLVGAISPTDSTLGREVGREDGLTSGSPAGEAEVGTDVGTAE